MLKIFEICGCYYGYDQEAMDLYQITDFAELDRFVSEPTKCDEFGVCNELSKIVLNMSNMCNLECKYCYVKDGNYGRTNAKMSKATLISLVQSLVDEGLEKIDIVSFFGGEPLLNKELVLLGLKLFSSKFHVDIFEIVSNGWFLDDAFVKELEQYPVNLSISIDGPEDITDMLRGEKSYANAIKALNIAGRYKINRVMVSATFTSMHEELGYSRIDIENYFKDMGIPATVSNVMSSNSKYAVSAKINKGAFRFDAQQSYVAILENENGAINSYVYTLLQSLFFKTRSKNFCDDLNTSRSRAYDYNGDIYNCFHFWGRSEFKLESNNSRIKIIDDYNSKKNKSECTECWCANVCHCCIASIIDGNDVFPYTNSEQCVDQIAYEIVMEEFLAQVHAGNSERIAKNFISNFYVYA